MEVGDVSVLDGNYTPDRPAIIIEADVAAQAINSGETAELLEHALRALYLAGKAVVVIRSHA